MKLSFKKHPKNTGLARIGSPHASVDIKVNKKRIGLIIPPSWNSSHYNWIIRLMVVKENILEDGNENCSWKWIQLKKHFETEGLAREFLNNHIDFLERLNLYFYDDDE